MTDEQQILRLFEDGDRALVSANVAELGRIYADDYMQYDECGTCSTKPDLIAKLTSGAVRFLSMASTGRRVRFLHNDIALVHGSEVDSVERDGKPDSVRYIYLDVAMKRAGQWQIVASQLAKVP